jgi:hypothetical protein
MIIIASGVFVIRRCYEACVCLPEFGYNVSASPSGVKHWKETDPGIWDSDRLSRNVGKQPKHAAYQRERARGSSKLRRKPEISQYDNKYPLLTPVRVFAGGKAAPGAWRRPPTLS